MLTSSSSLHLEGYYNNEFRFSLKINPDEMGLRMAPGLHIQSPDMIVPGSLEVEVDVSGGQHIEETLRWRFDMRICPNDKTASDYPYDFEIGVVGFFEVNSNVSPNLAETIVRINAPSILYSAAREYIAMATGRSPFPALILPLLRFLPAPKEEQATEQLKLLPGIEQPTKTRAVAKKKKVAKKGVSKKAAN